MAFNFGTPKPVGGFTLPSSTPATTTGFALGAGDQKTLMAQTAPAQPLNFSLSATPKTTPSLSFGASLAGAPAPVGTAAAQRPPATTTWQSFFMGAGTPPTLASTTTSFTPIPPSTSSIPSGFSLSAATSAASTGGALKLTALATPTTSTVTTTTPSLGLGAAITTSQTSVVSTSSATTVTLAPTTTAAPIIPAAGSLTYAQLEDSINKWTIDLEEQGKFFINQAKQLNAWDTLLLSNGEKMLQLNDTIEVVKQEQKRLDQELDFILAQQNELDELSLPLEKELMETPIGDQNRFQTYQMAENIDSQLKQMSEDLKEIVEHLNENNRDEDSSDPMVQISRILNAHMNSLQWVDRSTSQISAHLDQISKTHDTYKKNRLIY